MSESPTVLILGAGLAGLACAHELQRHGVSFRIYEAGDRVGGRVQTDVVDGYRLDHGFQVYLDAYPEGRAIFDYEALELQAFAPGATVRVHGRFTTISDPWRQPWSALRSLVSPVGTVGDKIRTGKLRKNVLRGDIDDLWTRAETTTEERLRRFGFSDKMIERFFRPFFGGVFLERELETSSRFFDFVFRMFARGRATLPRRGMGELPAQLASGFAADSIVFGACAQAVDKERVTFTDGHSVAAEHIVLALPAPALARLLGREEPKSRSTTCVYFTADEAPIRGARVVLNGEGLADGPVNNLVVPSEISKLYAPAGKALVSCSVIGSDALAEEGTATLEDRVLAQMQSWFGDKTRSWKHLASYGIRHALPPYRVAQGPARAADFDLPEGVFACSDAFESPSIQGALAAGRRVGGEIQQKLAATSAR